MKKLCLRFIHCLRNSFRCFVVRYFMSILVLQSSWWRRESWLLCFCLPGVLWWLSGSSLRCHGVVCGLWLWYFLIILTLLFLWHHSYTCISDNIKNISVYLHCSYLLKLTSKRHTSMMFFVYVVLINVHRMYRCFKDAYDWIILFFIDTGKLRCLLFCSKSYIPV